MTREICALATLILLLWMPAKAQNDEVDPSGPSSGTADIMALVESLNPEDALQSDGSSESVVDFSIDCAGVKDTETQKTCWETFREYLIYYKKGYIQRYKVIRFQNLSTKVILFVVISLVILGMFFAWYQFRIAMNAVKARIKSGDTSSYSAEVQEISIGESGVVARSSYLGVIILIVSLAFFYLYLVFVYPIQEIF